MLGVRREGITEAAGKLQRAGFISYCRGHITVLDRSGLEKRACECYQVVKTEFYHLLPDATGYASRAPLHANHVATSGGEQRATASRPLIDTAHGLHGTRLRL